IFLPVDQPFLPPALLRRMARLWREGARMVAPQVEGELRGAPALFDRALWPELYKVEGDVGGRAVLRRYPEAVKTLAVDPAWLRDLDRPEDLNL
ncbi:MAG TPA: NTP transferase domain-containing protein, partial [Caldilineaceae bacterium]|nr:NTP transferase domain-containing protein [Caldilineaceae bacterium]